MKNSSGFCSEFYGIRVSRPPSVFSWDSVAKTLDRSKQLESPLPVEMHRAHASSSVTQRPPAASRHRPRPRPPTGCTRCGSTFYEGAGRPQPWTRPRWAELAATAPVLPTGQGYSPVRRSAAEASGASLHGPHLAFSQGHCPTRRSRPKAGGASRESSRLAASYGAERRTSPRRNHLSRSCTRRGYGVWNSSSLLDKAMQKDIL